MTTIIQALIDFLKDFLAFIKETIRVQFDKILLAGIFIGLVTLTVHLIHDAIAAAAAQQGQMMSFFDFVNWAETQSGTVLGALLTLVTGAVVKAALVDRPPTNLPPTNLPPTPKGGEDK